MNVVIATVYDASVRLRMVAFLVQNDRAGGFVLILRPGCRNGRDGCRSGEEGSKLHFAGRNRRDMGRKAEDSWSVDQKEGLLNT